MPTSLAAAVITLNEARHIPDCLASLGWADELLVVDAFSSDRTVDLAQHAGARVFLHPFETFARQRNYALDQAKSHWVLFVDADERVEGPLAAEILETVKAQADATGPAGYWVPRRNLMLGQWVRHAGWWPDYQMRLLLRDRARYDESQDPHEVVRLDGRAGYLNYPLLHYNYASVRELFSKQLAYAQREARTLYAQGERVRPRHFVTQPLREFYRRYVLLEGYKDGPLGLLLAAVMAWHRFQVFANVRRLSHIDGPLRRSLQ